jgi:hypothetical protein
MKALSVGQVSLVGILGDDFPLNYGNYFFLNCDDGKSYYVSNFYYENFTQITFRNDIQFPIEVKALNERTLMIVDERIPKDWFPSVMVSTLLEEEFKTLDPKGF